MQKSIFFALLFLTLGSCQEPSPGEDDYLYDPIDDPETEPEEVKTGKFSAPPQNESIPVGESVTFSCAGDGENVLQIYRQAFNSEHRQLLFAGDANIPNDNRLSVVDTDFSISQVRTKDAGFYYCVYQSSVGWVNVTHSLHVLYAPFFSPKRKQPSTVQVAMGHNVQLACWVRGNPKPTVSWTKISGHDSAEPLQNGNLLSLGAATRAMAGEYECRASNGVGDDVVAERTLLVEYPPAVRMSMNEIHTGEGDNLQLNCTVYAFPAANVTWLLGEEPLVQDTTAVVDIEDGGHIHSLTLDEINDATYGEYTCFAENEEGESRDIVLLTDVPSTPTVESLTKSAADGSHTLIWSTNSFYPIESYSLMYRREKANESSDEPGEWEIVEVSGEDVEEHEKVGKYYHSFKVILPALDKDARYEVASLSVHNSRKESDKLDSYIFDTSETAADLPPQEQHETAQAEPMTTEGTASAAPVSSPLTLCVGWLAAILLLLC